MYAHLSTSHSPLDRISLEPHVRNGGAEVTVSGQLGHDLYVSFTPDEARMVAAELVQAADKAEQAQARIDALQPPAAPEEVAQ